MSLLNRMLRDLAQRQPAGGGELAGVRPVGPRPARRWPRQVAFFAVAVVLLTGLMLGGRSFWLQLHRAGGPARAADGRAAATAGAPVPEAVARVGDSSHDASASGGPAKADAQPKPAVSRLTGVAQGSGKSAWLTLSFSRDVDYRVEHGKSADKVRVILPHVTAPNPLPVLDTGRDGVQGASLEQSQGNLVVAIRLTPGTQLQDSYQPPAGGQPASLALALSGPPAASAEQGGTSAPPAHPAAAKAAATESASSPAPGGGKGGGAKPADSSTAARSPAARGDGSEAPSQGRGQRVASAAGTATGASGGAPVMEKHRDVPDTRQRVQHLIQRGDKALGRGQLATAEADYRSALRADPHSRRARQSLAALMIHEQRYHAAARLIDRGLAGDPHYSPYVRLKARVLAAGKGPKAALALLEKSPPAVEDDPAYHALMAALYQQTGQYARSVHEYRALVEVNPDAGVWWLGAAISLEGEQHPRAALQAYERARGTNSLGPRLLAYANSRIKALKKTAAGTAGSGSAG